MRATAHVKGRPIHPFLVVFPTAFLTGAFLFDLAGYLLDYPGIWILGTYLILAGIASGLLAAIPGIIDYFFTVPSRSSAKVRATRHALLNVSALVIFALSFLFRDRESSGFIVLTESMGVFLLTVAGWMGGTLVHRNQIGVDMRYADAGRWKEAYFRSRGEEIKVAETDALKVNQMMLLHVNGKRVVLGRSETGYKAFSDHCTHRGGSLAGGSMICGTVQCPWHGSQFDAESGTVKAGPATDTIAVYRVSEKEGGVFLDLAGLK